MRGSVVSCWTPSSGTWLVGMLLRSGSFWKSSQRWCARPERSLRQRRIAFYGRHGASVVVGAPDYRAPSTTGPELLHYSIMRRPVRSAEPLAGELLARCVSAILVQDYELG